MPDPALRDTATAPAPRQSPAPEPAAPAAVVAPPSGGTEFTLDALLAAWPDLVAVVRDQSRFLGEAMSTAQPVGVAPPDLTIALGEPNPMFHEKLEQQARIIEEVVGRAVGAPVRLRVGPPAGQVPSEPPARRMSQASIRADRLKGLRARDAALDTAADELDLEILD